MRVVDGRTSSLRSSPFDAEGGSGAEEMRAPDWVVV